MFMYTHVHVQCIRCISFLVLYVCVVVLLFPSAVCVEML